MLFLGWFRMRSRCDWCGLIYEREPGFFLGSIYVNYGLTALLTTAAYIVMIATDTVSQQRILWLLTAFCILFPAWFFRYAQPVDGFRSVLGSAGRGQGLARVAWTLY